jgi:hypothetical protein
MPLYSRGPRSGPGYVVPAHQRLTGPIRPIQNESEVDGFDEGDTAVDASKTPINLAKNDRSLSEFPGRLA